MNNKILNNFVRTALKEDVGPADVTTNLLFSSTHLSEGVIFAKEPAVLCGTRILKEVYSQLDPRFRVVLKKHDGDKVKSKEVFARLYGRTRAMLSGERVALNYLSYLSAIATRTRLFCDAIKPYHAKIMDTRKTTPGLRILERYAVACGGGVNHRFGLHDMVLVKDNHRAHILKTSSLAQMVNSIRKETSKKIEVEVDSFAELKDVLRAPVDVILLDNMATKDLKKAVSMVHQSTKGSFRPLLEASGGINIKNVRQVASTGVDRISIGALTHSRQAIDISLEVVDA